MTAFKHCLLLICVHGALAALDIEGAKETTCFPIKETVTPDLSWVMSVTDWNYIQGNRLDIYLSAMEMTGRTADELSEEEIYNDMCLSFQITGGKFLATAFGGKKKSFDMRPVKGLEVVEFFTEEGALGGTTYTTLTDNKTFMVMPACWADGQMTWGVLSPLKKLPDETLEKIQKHVESLGFKREFFTGDMFKNCGGRSPSKNEL